MILLGTILVIVQIWVIVRTFKTIGELAAINERLNNLEKK